MYYFIFYVVEGYVQKWGSQVTSTIELTSYRVGQVFLLILVLDFRQLYGIASIIMLILTQSFLPNVSTPRVSSAIFVHTVVLLLAIVVVVAVVVVVVVIVELILFYIF
jgi:hypothetical protein